MTASAASVEGLTFRGLPEREPNQVHEARPAGKTEQQAGHKAQIGAPAWLIRDRIHHVTILSVIAAVELAWVAALIYGVLILA